MHLFISDHIRQRFGFPSNFDWHFIFKCSKMLYHCSYKYGTNVRITLKDMLTSIKWKKNYRNLGLNV